jgi:diadenosine tetraphosphatase ApaH/serine/threonine PP2A family protein phosphatase
MRDTYSGCGASRTYLSPLHDSSLGRCHLGGRHEAGITNATPAVTAGGPTAQISTGAKEKARLPVHLASGPWKSPKKTMRLQLPAHTRVLPRQQLAVGVTTGCSRMRKIHKRHLTDAASFRQGESHTTFYSLIDGIQSSTGCRFHSGDVGLMFSPLVHCGHLADLSAEEPMKSLRTISVDTARGSILARTPAVREVVPQGHRPEEFPRLHTPQAFGHRAAALFRRALNLVIDDGLEFVGGA